MASWGKKRGGAQGWLALELAASRLDVAQGALRPGASPQVVNPASYASGGNPQADLKRLRKGQHLERQRCVVLLAPGQYHFIQVEEPAVPAQELKDAVRWQLKEFVDFSVEDATLDLLPIPATGGRGGQTFAVIAQNSLLSQTIQLLQGAGMNLVAIDVPEVAQRNVAALFEDENRGLAFLHFNAHGGLLTFTYRGDLYGVRRIDITADQLQQAEGERRDQLFERIGLEMQRSLDNFERLYTSIPLSKLVLAPCAQAEALMAYLGDLIFVPLHLADLTQVMDVAAVPELREPALQGARLSLLGATLRGDA